MPSSSTSRLTAALLIILGIVVLLVGLALLVGGGYLVVLGGSWYFALAGAGLLVSGLFLIRQRLPGAVVYLLVFAASVVWSMWDVGLAFWPLFPGCSRWVWRRFPYCWRLRIFALAPVPSRYRWHTWRRP